MLTLVSQPVLAQVAVLPSGMSVAAGQAQMAINGNRMTVVNTPQTILNWNSFNIGANAAVSFQQASAASSVLNRVTGNDPSAILGSLSSNGRVWLLNPNGVIFGAGARVDVAGLVTSTLRLNDSDWLAGRYSFAAGNPDATVLNQGELHSSFGGTIALLGDSVRNEGLIQVDGGQIILAAGKSIELVDTGAPNLGVRIKADAGAARNLGTLQAAGGRIDIHAAAVNQSGIVSADGFGMGPGGEIWIKAGQAIELSPDSRTSADGSTGGKVQVESVGARTSLAGTVSALGASSRGGQVALLGQEVGLTNASSIDVSGALGGGVVVVGGGLRGQDLRYSNAQAVYFGPQSRITADSTQNGDGGSIVLWSDKSTRAFGALSVRGGATGGDGGFIETSGGWLDSRPARVDTSAPKGRSGQWLLDPFNVTISDFVSDQNVDFNGNGSYVPNATNATIASGTILAALNNGTSVTVSTGGVSPGAEFGDLDVSAFIVTTSNSVGNLTLIADRNLSITSSVIGSNNANSTMSVTLLAGRSTPGSLTLSNSTISIAGAGSILLGGVATGNTPFGGTFLGVANGISISAGSVISAATGDVTIHGVQGATSAPGVDISNSSISGANVVIKGDGGALGNGVQIASGSSVMGQHSADIQGVGLSLGISIADTASVSVLPSSPDATASLSLLGRSGPTGDSVGVHISASGAESASVRAGNGATLLIEGATDPANSYSIAVSSDNGTVVIDGSGGGALTLRDHSGGQGILLSGANVVGGGGATRFEGSTLQMSNNATISSAGTVAVAAASVSIDVSSSITSNASGDAIVLSGSGTTAMIDFLNGAGASALSAPSGRWITYAADPLGSWSPGGLINQFTRYGSSFGGWAADSGKGFVFSAPQTATFTAIVTPRPYNGGVAVPLSNVTVTTPASLGDSGSLKANVTASYTNPNAGVGKPANFNNPTPFQFVDSRSNPVFGYTVTGSLIGTVTPLNIFGEPFVNSRAYDGTPVASMSVPTISGLLGSETVRVIATATYADSSVGADKPVISTSYALADGANGGRAINYSFTATPPQVGLYGTITPRPVSVTGLSAASKVYDGTTDASLVGTPAFSSLSGDALSLAGIPVASFLDKNAGVAKQVSVSGLSLGGPSAGNYTLVPIGTLTANITPKPLDLSGVQASSKVYDGNTTAQLTGVPVLSLLSNDNVTLVGTLAANFADKNVGTGKAVTVSGLSLGGFDAGNYLITMPSGLRADITLLALNLQGLSAAGKVYDATTAAAISGTASVSPLAGDSVLLAGSAAGNFKDKNVGSAKPVTVTGFTLNGADAANYALVAPPGLTADITARGLGIAGLSVLDKVYDASTAAALSGTASVAPLAGDVVALGGQVVANFSDKNVGAAKGVGVAGYTLVGADAANYALVQPQGLKASITPRAVTVTGLAGTSKVYDGTVASAVSGTAKVGTLAGDAVALNGSAVASFSDKNVGSGKLLAVTGYTLVGSDASNYTLTQPQGVSAGITPLTVTVSGLTAQNKVYDGTTVATVTGAARVGTLTGDAVALAGTGVATFANKNVGTARPVAVGGYSLAGADAGNYSLVAPQGLAANITPATLLYVAAIDVRTVGQVVDGLGGSVTGFVAGESLSSATQGALTFQSLAPAGAPAGTYGVVGSGLSAANYVFAQATGNEQALTVIDLSPLIASVLGSDRAVGNGFSVNTLALNASREQSDSGTFDFFASSGFGGNAPPNGDFGAVRLASLSASELQSLLSGRRLFMQNLLDESTQKLERDPGLADLRECQSAEDAKQGTCIITARVKDRLAAQMSLAQSAGVPAASPTSASSSPSAVPPAPVERAAPPVLASASPAAAPAVPPATVVAAVRPPAPALVPRLDFSSGKRKVREAALPQIERKIALVIGVDSYADGSIPSLSNAVGDARAVGKVFETRLGYETVVLDNATKSAVVAALNQLALTLGPRDSVVVYYAGHGELVETTKLGYWLLSDSIAKQPETWLSNTDISRLIAQIGASQVALVSDSCYSGSLASEERIRALASTLDPKAVLDKKSVVVMSSGGNEPVFDDGKDGHSPFAWNLMNTLSKVSTWQAGGNVFERVRFAVARTLPQRPQYSASKAAGHQPGGDYLFEERQLEARQ